MLPMPATIATNPLYAPLVRVCEGVLLTGAEVAKHWRYSRQHLHNVRSGGRGPAYIKLMDGAIRYRLSEVLAYEISGQRGAWTPERVSLALATMPGMTADMRQKIERHLALALAE